MEFLILFLITFATYHWQYNFLPVFLSGGSLGNWLFVWLFLVVFFRKRTAVFWVALVVGSIRDMLAGNTLGQELIIIMALALLFNTWFLKKKYKVSLGVAWGHFLFFGLIYYLILIIFKEVAEPDGYWARLLGRLAPSAFEMGEERAFFYLSVLKDYLISAFLILPLGYWLFKPISQFFDLYEERRIIK